MLEDFTDDSQDGREFKRSIESVLASLQKLIDDRDGPEVLKKVDPEFSFEELMIDTDRGCLLSAAAFLDGILENRIRLKLRELSGAGKDDLDFLLKRRPLPPLGSLGVRIVMARVLGIIDGNTRAALAAMQDMRNANAHSWRSFRFTEKDIKSITKHLDATHRRIAEDGAVAFELFIKKQQGPLADLLSRPSREKLEFIFAITTLVRIISPVEE